MKSLFLSLLILAASSSAFAQAISNAQKISLRCEQGVGNLPEPRPFITLEGIVDGSKIGELTSFEKDALDLQVYDGTKMIKLNSSEYKMNVDQEKVRDSYVSNAKVEVTLLTEKSRFLGFKILDFDGSEATIEAIAPSSFTGKPKAVDGGICWGLSPY